MKKNKRLVLKYSKGSASDYRRQDGFTLIELLVVIAIIGVLASVVITSLTGAREKASRAATLATLKGVIPELTTCKDDQGAGYIEAIPTVDTTFICQDLDTGNAALVGHEGIFWPALSGGWTYNQPTGALSDDTYSFSASKTDQVSVVCTISTGACE